MSQRPRAVLITLWAASVFGGDFWLETPFHKWSDQEVGRMLTGSPWAQKAEVKLKGNVPAGMPRISVIVRWQTAVPIRQAVARFHFGEESGTSEKIARMLQREEPCYIAGVVGLPGPLAGAKVEDLRSAASLRIRGRFPIPAVEILTDKLMSGAYNVFFFFPKQEPGAHIITLDDEEVEFVLDVPWMEIRRPFKLKELVYNGRLEL